MASKDGSKIFRKPRYDEAPRDEDGCDGDECEVNVGARFIAGGEASNFACQAELRSPSCSAHQRKRMRQDIMKATLVTDLVNVNESELKGILLSEKIIAYGLWEKHTFAAAWGFLLYTSGGKILEFSSAASQLDGWEEFGSLKIQLLGDGSKNTAIEARHPKLSIGCFSVTSIEIILYEDEHIISECGLVLAGSEGREIVIATGIPTGSVSIDAPFATEPFQPEYSFLKCSRKPFRKNA